MEPFPLVSHGARLKALLAPPRGRPLIVFCHGFPGRNWNQGVARELVALGYGALLFRYRGAHGSEGAYSFHHNEEDILVAIEAARPHATHGLGLLGYSMGGFHATRVLAQEPDLADLLVLQAPLATVGGFRTALSEPAWMAFLETAQGLLNAPTGALVEEARSLAPDEEAVALAPRIRKPALVLHGTADLEVPPEHGRLLHDGFAGPKRFVALEGADHYLAGHEKRMAAEIDVFWRAGKA